MPEQKWSKTFVFEEPVAVSQATLSFLVHSLNSEETPKASFTLKGPHGQERTFKGSEVSQIQAEEIDLSYQIFFNLSANGLSVHGNFIKPTSTSMYSLAMIEATSEHKAAMFEGVFTALQRRFMVDGDHGSGFIAKACPRELLVRKKQKSDSDLGDRQTGKSAEPKTSDKQSILSAKVQEDVSAKPATLRAIDQPPDPTLAGATALREKSSMSGLLKIIAGGMTTILSVALAWFFGCTQTKSSHFSEVLEGGAQFKLVKLQPKQTKEEVEFDVLTHSTPFDVQIVNVGRATASGLVFRCGTADEHGPVANLGTLGVQEKVEIHSHLYDGDSDPLHANDKTCFSSYEHFLQFNDATGKGREVRFDLYGNATPSHE